MNENEQILSTLLAHVDSLWGPNRANVTVVAERRRQFIEAGLPMTSKPLGEFDAMLPGHRTLQNRLAEAGIGQWIECVGTKGGRTDAVRLTDAGDEHARALCGLPTLGDALAVASQIHDLRHDPNGVDQNGFAWIAEDVVGGVTPEHYVGGTLGVEGKELLAKLQVTLLPCLWRGIVVSSCDVHRRCWYAVRPSRVTSYRKQNYPAVELPKADDTAWDHYVDTIKLARGTLHRSTPESINDVGDIPFSCSPFRRGGAAA